MTSDGTDGELRFLRLRAIGSLLMDPSCRVIAGMPNPGDGSAETADGAQTMLAATAGATSRPRKYFFNMRTSIKIRRFLTP